MKYLILLEGSVEKAFIELLMDKGMLKIEANEMLDMRPHQKRQIEPSLQALIRQLSPEEKVKIIKIGDTLTDKLKIPFDIREKVIAEEKYCTKPEFEILIIILEGLYSDYQKVKSKQKPKSFAKARVSHLNCKYNNTPSWIKDYFNESNIRTSLRLYKQMTKHKKNELYLYDLLS